MSGQELAVLGTFDPLIPNTSASSASAPESSGPSIEQQLKEAQDLYDKLLLLGIMKIDAQNKLKKQKELLLILKEITAPAPSLG